MWQNSGIDALVRGEFGLRGLGLANRRGGCCCLVSAVIDRDSPFILQSHSNLKPHFNKGDTF
jgi:hypothetical protein